MLKQLSTRRDVASNTTRHMLFDVSK